MWRPIRRGACGGAALTAAALTIAPYCTRPDTRTQRDRRDGDLPTPGTLARDQLVLDDHRPRIRVARPPAVAVRTCGRRPGRRQARPAHRSGRCRSTCSGSATGLSVDPGAPDCLLHCRPLLLLDCGRDRASPSDEAGLEEFNESDPSRRRSSAFSAVTARYPPATVQPRTAAQRPPPRVAPLSQAAGPLTGSPTSKTLTLRGSHGWSGACHHGTAVTAGSGCM